MDFLDVSCGMFKEQDPLKKTWDNLLENEIRSLEKQIEEEKEKLKVRKSESFEQERKIEDKKKEFDEIDRALREVDKEYFDEFRDEMVLLRPDLDIDMERYNDTIRKLGAKKEKIELDNNCLDIKISEIRYNISRVMYDNSEIEGRLKKIDKEIVEAKVRISNSYKEIEKQMEALDEKEKNYEKDKERKGFLEKEIAKMRKKNSDIDNEILVLETRIFNKNKEKKVEKIVKNRIQNSEKEKLEAENLVLSQKYDGLLNFRQKNLKLRSNARSLSPRRSRNLLKFNENSFTQERFIESELEKEIIDLEHILKIESEKTKEREEKIIRSSASSVSAARNSNFYIPIFSCFISGILLSSLIKLTFINN